MTAVGLAVFSVVTSVFLSRAIVSDDHRYGAIGVGLVLTSLMT